MRRCFILVAAPLVVAAQLVLASAAARASTPQIQVELPGIKDFATLAVGDHCVFIDGPFGPLVVVDRTTMAVTATVPNLATYQLLAHGDDVFVSPIGNETVERYTFSTDCTQSTVTDYPESPLTGDSPRLAWLSGTLWVLAAHNSTPSLGEVDLATGTVTPNDLPNLTGVLGLRSDAGQPDRVYALGNRLKAVDVIAGVPEVSVTGDRPGTAKAWAPAPDGSQVFVFGSKGGKAFDGSTLIANGLTFRYASANTGADADPTRARVATFTWNNGVPATITVWSTATQTLLVRQALPTTEVPLDDGLRYSPDGADIFAVTRSSTGSETLWKLAGAAEGASLSIGGHSAITYGQSVTLTVKCPQAALSTDHLVSVYATPTGGLRKLVAQGSIGDGTFSFSTTPKANTRYDAEWDGDASYLPAGASHRVGVRMRAKTALTGNYAKSGTYKLFHPGSIPRYAVVVAPNHAGMVVVFALDRRTSSGGWKLISTSSVKLSATSAAGVKITHGKVGYAYRVSVDVPADTDHGTAKVPWSYFRFR